MSRIETPKLSDDPKKALLEIAERLISLIPRGTLAERAVPAGCDPRACDKYWLSVSELYELQGFGAEAERVAELL